MDGLNERLLELETVRQRNDAIKHNITITLEALKQQIKELDAEVENLDSAIRKDVLSYLERTGDTNPHPCVVIRKTPKWMYDKEAMLRAAKENGATEYVRVKEELDVRAFERALKADDLEWAKLDAELAYVPVVEIRKLGELTILAEAAE